MAVYIKKERLGSGGRQSSSSSSAGRSPTLARIESMKSFQQLQQSYAEAAAKAKEGLKDKYEGNAEVQHWRTQMTPEQRSRDAIERMVPTAKSVVELRNGGKEASYEEARKFAENLAYKSDAQKKEES